MKKTALILLALAASTGAFAKSNDSHSKNRMHIASRVEVTSEDKLQVVVEPLQSRAEVFIVDHAGNSIFEERINLAKGLRQKFDLNSLEPGLYYLKIETGNQTVTKEFSINEEPSRHSIYVQYEAGR